MAETLFVNDRPVADPKCSACGKASGHLLTCRFARRQGMPLESPVLPPETRHRKQDPDTSAAAARSLAGIRHTQAAILSALVDLGSGTDEEIAQWCHDRDAFTTPSGMRTRRSELVAAGWVVDSTERRALMSGRQGIVWRITPAGVVEWDRAQQKAG